MPGKTKGGSGDRDRVSVMNQGNTAKRIRINGIVQGVGFRPFIYQLAHHYLLKGEVANTATGVDLIIEGPPVRVEQFIQDIPTKKPPLAHITDVSWDLSPVIGYTDFSIVKSKQGTSKKTLISPDVTVCEDCLMEMRDPGNRRYRYPFINCTNCGPRYTIIKDVPYDRPNTSMRDFKLCRRCRMEYDDPNDRRFHAQPNACPLCGPHVTLFDAEKNPIASDDPIKKTAELLKQGSIVAIKGLGGFHLAVDATLNHAVKRLRKRKAREEKPFAMMCLNLDAIRAIATVDQEQKALLTAIQKPIVLLEKKKGHPIAEAVSPKNRYFGVMLPYTPLHYLLLEEAFTALVMTSGNLSEEPIAIDNEDAFHRLGNIADFFLMHNREICLRSDDSIVRYCGDAARFIRRSRGYVPVPVFMKDDLPQILACGAELKNTVCLTKGKNAFVSQHIGDLENRATEAFFENTIDHLQKILDITPKAAACDMHPDYMSTRYAANLGSLNCIRVQHHHAHIAACMAENKIDGPVIGLAFDGTGFGPDNTIWGGEVLIAGYSSYIRAAHLETIPMPGSAAAIKEPWRMAVSYLYGAFGSEFLDLDLPLIKSIGRQHIQRVIQMIDKRVNTPLTSSMGRLFDGLSAIAGIGYRNAFEGQAAMEFEMMADKTVRDTYDYQLNEGDPIQISPRPIIEGMVKDLNKSVPVPVISGKFHATLCALFTDLCIKLRKRHSLNKVALSGGVFQNALLLTGLMEKLTSTGFDVYAHRLVPTNDGGISLGQAVVAGATING